MFKKKYFCVLKIITGLFLIMIKNYCIASEEKCYSNLNEVMKCFVQYKDDVYGYKILEQNNNDIISTKTYILDSQKWPITQNQEIPTTTWTHRMIIYTPKNIEHNQALFYVSGGYNRDIDGNPIFYFSKEFLDYSKIALENKAVVVVLEDVPNQYLFINSEPKKEDQILAITYRKVMENPMENAYLAGHLPMVKSIIKAMDASQEILLKEDINIENFIMVGASKRGWAAWLAALEDDRVSAIIPVVIDILGVQKNINHICNSYKLHCPPALRDYHAEGIIKSIKEDNFTQLMQIEDPLSYIKLPLYAKQASIPKYIINTAGDDFYSPDSSKFYFQDLKGENYIRYLPKAMHYLAGNPISDHLNNIKTLNEAVNNYFYFHLNNISLPNVSWNFSETKIDIESSTKPEKIILWTAQNENERDFRFLNSYSKLHLWVKTAWVYISKYLPFTIEICDNCYESKEIENNCADDNICQIEVSLPPINKGWRASFVELHYNIDDREFVITTQARIFPDTYPEFLD